MSGSSPSSGLSTREPQAYGPRRPGRASGRAAVFSSGRPRSSILGDRRWEGVSWPVARNGKKATQPCPCGYYANSTKECTCSEPMVSRYQKRISGPLLDRIDVHVEVPRVQYEKLADERLGESSARIRERVEAARGVQRRRFPGTKLTCNSEMGPAQVREYCKVDAAAQGLLKAAMNQLHLSARGFHRILKLARTIADLAGSEMIGAAHVADAVQYRPRGRG
ncbi:MAG: ATP-binding protein [Chloroflexi bacterium]|nr:ATP-binding protein [Chloroflexota bacterium]